MPLRASQRFEWRLALLLISLDVCRAKSASVEQLHTLVWALSDDENMRQFVEAWNVGTRTGAPMRGYSSGLVGVVKVALSEGLIEQNSSGRQKLTERGVAVVSAGRQ